MLIPSIDLMNGSAVQLIGGQTMALNAGDPLAVARRFRVAGELAVIDLDAALGQGSNKNVIEEILRMAPCRVGGGIRDVETAIRWLDAGAKRVILGTAARPEILEQLPRERVIVALDALHDEVVVNGWRTKTGKSVEDELHRLRDLVGGFLITFVEREGRMQGIDLQRVATLRRAAGDASLTIAGGIASNEELAALDALNVDAQVGMALYTGRIHLADAVAAPLIQSNNNKLWPTVVCDEAGVALGLAWSNRDSLRAAIDSGRGVYFSRSRSALWEKGRSSGNIQELMRIALDCDGDAIRFTVRQHGHGFCHKNTRTCWGDAQGFAALESRILQRLSGADPDSFTLRVAMNPEQLRAKLVEEANELGEATNEADVVHEAADVMYFTLVSMARAGVSLARVAEELDRRASRVTRRAPRALILPVDATC